jgi:hypothetical protein
MKPALKKWIRVSVLTAGAFVLTAAQAVENGLYYHNHAYIYAIPEAPNPVSDTESIDPKIIYVNTGYGQAIYSYPVNVALQQTEFNVEYVDTAYGHAIYSYPYNKSASMHPKHHLNLSINANNQHDGYLPVSLSNDKMRADIIRP